jgi:hypothetical protein
MPTPNLEQLRKTARNLLTAMAHRRGLPPVSDPTAGSDTCCVTLPFSRNAAYWPGHEGAR